MKNRIFSILGVFILIASVASAEEVEFFTVFPNPDGAAQNFDTTGDTNLATDEHARVGVGTDDPQAKVEIVTESDSTVFMGENDQTALLLRNSDETDSNFVQMGMIGGDAETPAATVGAHFYDHGLTGGAGGALVFGTREDASVEERMRIDRTGRVGIGTDTPMAALNIKGIGTGNYAGIQVQNTWAEDTEKGGLAVIGARKDLEDLPFSGFGTWDNGTDRILYLGGGGWSLPDASSIRFFTSAASDETPSTGAGSTGNGFSERVRIDGAGNVGVGTTTPRSDAPNGVTKGNMDVNDIFVRSAGANGAWLSQGGAGAVIGTYTGTGYNWQNINLGFRPKYVEVHSVQYNYYYSMYKKFDGMPTNYSYYGGNYPNYYYPYNYYPYYYWYYPYYYSWYYPYYYNYYYWYYPYYYYYYPYYWWGGRNQNQAHQWKYTYLNITNNGFQVYGSYYYYPNMSGQTYYYIAYR